MLRAILLISCMAVTCCYAIPQYAATIRPPSYPLAVRTPYVSLWLNADTLPGNWPSFWTGRTKGWEGLIRVDGVTYEWMGAASTQSNSPIQNVAIQTGTYVTPTQTIFELQAGPVNMTVTFLSPVEYDDMIRQSIPLSYVFITVASNDGASHSVQVYQDITGEWGSSEMQAIVRWDLASTGNLKTWSTERQTQYAFAEDDEYAEWGQGVFTTTSDASHASGSDVDIRGTFVSQGMLDNVNDPNFRCVSCDWPTFAFVHDLGSVNARTEPLKYIVGHVRENNINLHDEPKRALWREFFASTASMLLFFFSDSINAVRRADEIDTKILTDAYETQGQEYANIIALSLRQAFGANEYSGNATHPIVYQKEISSGAFMQTVDVIYPTTPLFYYLNVQYIKYMLEPLWLEMETPGWWNQTFAMHDIGDRFPNVTGQGYGGDMPVEESANMLMMVGNYAFHPSVPTTESIPYVQAHYETLSGWATYLHDNCLYPTNQLTTDDFIGHTELNSGLALKGILAMKTFAKLSALVGNTNATNFYNNATSAYLSVWYMESIHDDGTHLKMEYNVTDGYQFKYNAFQDKLMSLDFVPLNVYELEAAYYLTKEEEFGTPFVNRHDYTKSDWEVWTAAAFGHVSPTLRQNLISGLSRFLEASQSRTPFTDWYVTATARQVGFQARPVAGGHFALLALNNPARP